METESLPGTWTLATPSCLLSCCKWIQEPPSPACPTLWSGQTAAASHARGGCISVIQRRWAAVPSLIRGDLALAQRPASPRPAGELREYTVPFRGLGPPGQPAPSQLPFGERAWGYMIPLRASGGCITHRCLTMALAPSSPVTSAWPAMENAVAPWKLHPRTMQEGGCCPAMHFSQIRGQQSEPWCMCHLCFAICCTLTSAFPRCAHTMHCDSTRVFCVLKHTCAVAYHAAAKAWRAVEGMDLNRTVNRATGISGTGLAALHRQ
ncbi:uncharacterized protein LOC127054874 isoform X3 [Gopherus flavomarginatus]|nr:uncharacterized protein LOC127054874 isoform X3 [Gopherus flavomarginatus]